MNGDPETGFQVKAHIRWMIRRDLPEVMRIEEESFDYWWSESDFVKSMGQRNAIGQVAEIGDRVVGFMIYELHAKRLHVVNFAVHPEHRRMGVGRQLVEKLIRKLSTHRRSRLTLYVRESNLGGQLFYRSLGFRAVAVERGYYDDSGEDGFRFEYRVGAERETTIKVEDAANRITGHLPR